MHRGQRERGRFNADYDDESIRAGNCALAKNSQANLDAGVYNDETGHFLKSIGEPAVSAPEEPSQIIPGVTNYQAALLVGAGASPPPPFWHFVAGTFDDNGIPINLSYIKDRVWFDVLQNIPPHNPMKGTLDGNVMFCGQTPVPFTKHLDQIEVPILAMGAAGRFGKTIHYTAGLTASKDVTKVTVQLFPDDEAGLDFGHADTVLATNAQTLVWKPILEWVVAHR